MINLLSANQMQGFSVARNSYWNLLLITSFMQQGPGEVSPSLGVHESNTLPEIGKLVQAGMPGK